jgi:hypothetical protein
MIELFSRRNEHIRPQVTSRYLEWRITSVEFGIRNLESTNLEIYSLSRSQQEVWPFPPYNYTITMPSGVNQYVDGQERGRNGGGRGGGRSWRRSCDYDRRGVRSPSGHGAQMAVGPSGPTVQWSECLR